jgi:hypothetical protein
MTNGLKKLQQVDSFKLIPETWFLMSDEGLTAVFAT